MTSMNKTQDLRRPGEADRPGDIPVGQPAALSHLEVLLGEWEMGVCFAAGYFGSGSPPVAGRGGRTRFEWLDGEFFLIQRFTVGNPAARAASRSSAPVKRRGPSASIITTRAGPPASTN